MQGVGALPPETSILQMPWVGNVPHLEVNTGTPGREEAALDRWQGREEGLWLLLRRADSGLTFRSVIPGLSLSLFHWGHGREHLWRSIWGARPPTLSVSSWREGDRMLPSTSLPFRGLARAPQAPTSSSMALVSTTGPGPCG